MKFAFTTLGCPNWDLETIIQKAVEFGYDGVDFRGYLGTMEIYQSPAFSTDLEKTKKLFADAKLDISCFSSSVRLFTTSTEKLEHFLQELHEYGKLCQAFNTPYIRVFGGVIGDTPRKKALDIVESNVKQMLEVARLYGVTLILETHDDWTHCEYVAEVLKRADSEHLQVLWDVHHPFRTVGEKPETTWDMLGKHIKYTHWKDSFIKKDAKRGYQLCLMGEGDIPLKQIYDLLIERKYDGYFTLEWEKVWCPEIEEPEVAFPQFIEFMTSLKNQ